MSLLFTLGSIIHDWGRPENVPFWTKNGQTWQACQRSKVVQKGPRGTKMVNLSRFDHLGPVWVHLDPFGPFQTKMIFLPQMDKERFGRGAWEQKINSCLKGSRWAQNGTSSFKIDILRKNTIYDTSWFYEQPHEVVNYIERY